MLFEHLKKKSDFYWFYDLMESYIKKPPVALQENTLKKYRTALSNLKAFKRKLTLNKNL